MKKVPHLIFVTITVFVISVKKLNAQKAGNEIFKESCSACHTVGKGKLIGPDLANVHNHLTLDWFTKFVKSSQSLIKSGDKYADSIFNAYNKMAMPDHTHLSDDQIKSIYDYLKEASGGTEEAIPEEEILPGNIERGRELFVGNLRFTNGGASCNSCHNVNITGLITGGALAKDLTQSITRLSESGVASVIKGLPYPQMKETYSMHPITPQETADLTAFLVYVDEKSAIKTANYTGNYMLLGGGGGIVFLLSLYSFFWIKRKKQAVNKSVFNRQIKSV